MFRKKSVLKKFAKFKGNHQCRSLFLNKVAKLRPATLQKKAPAQVFSDEFCEIVKKSFFHRTPPVPAYVWSVNLIIISIR